MSTVTWTMRRNSRITTGIAGALLGAVLGSATTWIVVGAPLVGAPTQRVVAQQASNMGQYVVDNLGGTPAVGAAADTVSNMGQYVVDNLGGTPME